MTRPGGVEFDPAGPILVEYEQLKAEQRERIGFRDNLLYVTLASMAAVGFAAIQSPGLPALLLFLPPVSFVLGWNYQANDHKVSAIGDYIRSELAPRLASLTPGRSPVFGWETANRTDPRRASRNAMWLAVDLTVFILAPLVAVGIVWTQARPALLLTAASVVEVVATAALAYQIVRQADLQPTRTNHLGE